MDAGYSTAKIKRHLRLPYRFSVDDMGSFAVSFMTIWAHLQSLSLDGSKVTELTLTGNSNLRDRCEPDTARLDGVENDDRHIVHHCYSTVSLMRDQAPML